MTNQRLHTPEGVRDVFGSSCDNLQYLENRLSETIESFGFRQMKPPAFEFSDVYGEAIGTVPENERYRFFDREGNTLVLRPDFTPSIARAAAKYFPDQQVLRLSYRGHIFQNHKGLQGHLREKSQIGAELMGENSAYADAEILSLATRALLSTGLKDFRISLGSAEIFDGLCEAAGFDAEETDTLTTYVTNKNFFGVSEFLAEKQAEKQLPASLVRLFSLLTDTYNAPSDWNDLYDESKGYPRIQQALSHLYEVNSILSLYGASRWISFDFSLIRSLRYYTGIIFVGYTYGTGTPVIRGGRYDRLLANFGRDLPATGFAISVDDLLLALERGKKAFPQKPPASVILFDDENRENAIKRAERMREAGSVILQHYCNNTERDALAKNFEGHRIMILGE